MYEMLFIDKNFEEIQDTFFALKKAHIRCYYSNGTSHDIPANKKEKLPFQYLKYVCLDWCINSTEHANESLEKGIAVIIDILTKFMSNEHYTLIINTSVQDKFSLQELKHKLKEHHRCPSVVNVVSKHQNVSVLHKDSNYLSHVESIQAASQEAILRDIILREAIEIENLLHAKIILHLSTIVSHLKPSQYDELGRFNFGGKINLYSYFNRDNRLKDDIQDFKALRNDWAHNPSPRLVDMFEILRVANSIKSRIV